MTIDLTKMTPDMTRELNRIAEDYRKSYTEFVDCLSDVYGKDDFWWDTPLVSRNIYLCRCFEDVCTLRLALNLVEREKPDELIVSDERMREAIAKNIRSNQLRITVKSAYGIKTRLKKINVVKCVLVYRRVRRRMRLLQACHRADRIEELRGKRITLVNTYRVPAEIKDGKLHDRYFPGLQENSDENIVFSAILSFENDADGKRLIAALLERADTICLQRYVCSEDFREVRRYIRWCLKTRIDDCEFDGMQIQSLVQGAIRDGSKCDNAMIGIMLGRTVCRLIEQYDLKVDKLIDWYEGQPSSNAMIRRFRAKYPSIPTVGYVNFPFDDMWMAVVPSAAQMAARAVPEKYAVIGRIFQETYRRYCPNAKTLLGPALRIQRAAELSAAASERIEAVHEKKILVALPYFVNEARVILSMLNCCSEYLRESEAVILLKNHPVHIEYAAADYGIDPVAFAYTFVSGSYDDAAKQADLVITASSTTSYETVLYGKPVISVSAGGLCTPQMPHAWEGIHYGIAYDAEDMERLIRKFLSEPYERLDSSAEDYYFVKTNRVTVKRFLEDCER